MNKKQLMSRVIVYLLLLLVCFVLIGVKQEQVRQSRQKEVVSPITEWERLGKPVDVVTAVKKDFYELTKVTAVRDRGGLYHGYVTQQDQRKVKVGQKIYFSTQQATVIGDVMSVSKERDLDKGLFEVKVALSSNDNQFSHREIVFIHTGTIENVLQLPLAVFDLTADGQFYVNTFKDNVCVQQDVVMGAVNSEFVVVASGVEEGDQVIVNGKTLIYPGDRLYIRKELE